jgi:hypothetical protein
MASSDTDRHDPVQTRPIPAGRRATRFPGGGMRRGLARSIATGAAVLLVALLALLGLRSIADWPNFGDKEIDRSGPAVLTAMRDLAEYHAAAGQYQIVVDLEQDAKFLPDIIKGKRVIFLATGSIRLPRAQLSAPNVDPEQSRVLNRDLGVIDRLGGLFSDQPNPQDQQMYVLAKQKLAAAATQVGLQAKAEQNTRATLEQLMRSLGFTNVEITFVDPAAGG